MQYHFDSNSSPYSSRDIDVYGYGDRGWRDSERFRFACCEPGGCDGHFCVRIGVAGIDYDGADGNMLGDGSGYRGVQLRRDVDCDRRDDHFFRGVYSIGGGNWKLHRELDAGWVHECVRVGDDHRRYGARDRHVGYGFSFPDFDHDGADGDMLGDGSGDRSI